MTRDEMLAELQEVVNDSAVSGVWTQATLLRYLSEGQDKFCEETGYFTDISNFTLTLQTDVAVYAIPDRIIQLVDIWDGARRLSKVLTGNIYSDVDAIYGYIEAVGPPSHWQTDQETGFIKLYPTPTLTENGDTLILQVWRYSRYDLAGDGAVAGVDALPEIPSRFQRACIEWAAYKAFMHHDMETQDPVKAKEHLNTFHDYTADGIRALRRIQNQETRVGSSPAYRT